MNISNFLSLLFILFSNLSISQQKNLVYETGPPELGKDPDAIVIFQLLSDEEIKQKGINVDGAKRYNSFVKKHAQIYTGEKTFMTTQEINEIELSESNKYKYVFSIQAFRGFEKDWYPFNYGLTQLDTGITYVADMRTIHNGSKECKLEITFIESKRKDNAGK